MTALPSFLQAVSRILPLTYGIEGARKAVLGASFDEVKYLIGAEALFMVVLIVLGYFFFRYFEQKAKKKGSLELI